MASDSKDVYRGPLLDLQPTPLLSVNNVDLSNLILIPTSLVTPFTLSFQKRQKCYFYNLLSTDTLVCFSDKLCAELPVHCTVDEDTHYDLKQKTKTIEKSRFHMSTTGFFIQEGYFPRTRSSPRRREIRFFLPDVLFSPPQKLAIQTNFHKVLPL